MDIKIMFLKGQIEEELSQWAIAQVYICWELEWAKNQSNSSYVEHTAIISIT